MTLRILLQRLRFLTSLLYLGNAILENEAMFPTNKLRIKVIKDRKGNHEAAKGESIINLLYVNEVLEGLILTKEVTDDNENLILLSEICFQINLMLTRT